MREGLGLRERLGGVGEKRSGGDGTRESYERLVTRYSSYPLSLSPSLHILFLSPSHPLLLHPLPFSPSLLIPEEPALAKGFELKAGVAILVVMGVCTKDDGIGIAGGTTKNK